MSARLSEQIAGLTDREFEVVQAVANSDHKLGNIAADLGMSEPTLRHHLEHIHGKLDVRNRQGITLWALRAGILEVTP